MLVLQPCIVLLVYSVLFIPSSGYSDETTNVVVVSGNPMVLRTCGRSEDATIFWHNCNEVGAQKCDVIFNGWKISNNFSHFFVTNRSDLSTNETLLTDAGAFKCIAAAAATGSSIEERVLHWTRAIVLASNPSCTTDKSGSNTDDPINITRNTSIRLWCEVRFQGSWNPSMRWSIDTVETILEGVNESTTSFPNYTSVTSVLTVSNERRHSKNGKVKFLCTTYFSPDGIKIPSAKAANVPDYEYSWTSPWIIFSQNENDASDVRSDISKYLIGGVVVVLISSIIISILIKKYQKVKIELKGKIAECASMRNDGSNHSKDVEIISSHSGGKHAPTGNDIQHKADGNTLPRGTIFRQLSLKRALELDRSQTTVKEQSRKKEIVGKIDGTVYADMKSTMPQCFAAPSTRKKQPVAVIYASIDHTQAPPHCSSTRYPE